MTNSERQHSRKWVVGTIGSVCLLVKARGSLENVLHTVTGVEVGSGESAFQRVRKAKANYTEVLFFKL